MFFENISFALIKDIVFLITNRINSCITKSLRFFFSSNFLGVAFEIFCMSKNLIFHLHNVKFIWYCCYLMLYSIKDHYWKKICNKLCTNLEMIQYKFFMSAKKTFCKKSCSVKGVNGMPPNTLKLFSTKCFFLFSPIMKKSFILSFQDF